MQDTVPCIHLCVSIYIYLYNFIRYAVIITATSRYAPCMHAMIVIFILFLLEVKITNSMAAIPETEKRD